MKGKFWALVFVVVFVAPCMFFVGCDLSHKHYLDDYGVCKTCGEDTAVNMTRNNNNEYISEEAYCQADDFTYFKFKANGEQSVTICVEEISTSVNYILFHSTNVNNLSLSHVAGEDLYFYANPLTEGETYYIKVKVYSAGKVKIRVSPNSQNG